MNDYEVRSLIVREGNKKVFGTTHQSPLVPQNAVKIRDSEGFIGKAVPFGIAPVVLCMLVVFLKAFINKEPPMSPIFLVPAILIGFIVAMPLHELAHAVCYPKEATVWVGLCIRKMQAWAISYHPLSKGRFIGMSLAPSLLGIVSLMGGYLYAYNDETTAYCMHSICIYGAYFSGSRLHGCNKCSKKSTQRCSDLRFTGWLVCVYQAIQAYMSKASK